MTTRTMIAETAAATAGRAWWFLDTLVVEHCQAGPTDQVVLESTLPVGAAPPLHIHHDLDDSWYLLDGQMVVRCGDELTLATAGHWVSLPRGVPHAFRVVGWHSARLLLVHSNRSFLDLVRDLGEPAEAAELPIPNGGPGLEALDLALASHDVTTVGPSMTEEEAQRFLSSVASPLGRTS